MIVNTKCLQIRAPGYVVLVSLVSRVTDTMLLILKEKDRNFGR